VPPNVVDRSGLKEQFSDGIPVLHLGQVDAIETVISATPACRWLVVDLWCSRDVAEQRISERGLRDLPDRMAAWDQTPHLEYPDLTFDTGIFDAIEVAREICQAIGAVVVEWRSPWAMGLCSAPAGISARH
jgi:guanylate kinase